MYTILGTIIVLVVATVAYGVFAVKRGLQDKSVKKVLGVNIGSFAILMIAATVFMLTGHSAFAADTTTTTSDGLQYVGAALSTGLASIGAGIAVAASGAAAIGAISEDEKLLGKTVIFVGLSEGIAIYGLIISIMILS